MAFWPPHAKLCISNGASQSKDISSSDRTVPDWLLILPWTIRSWVENVVPGHGITGFVAISKHYKLNILLSILYLQKPKTNSKVSRNRLWISRKNIEVCLDFYEQRLTRENHGKLIEIIYWSADLCWQSKLDSCTERTARRTASTARTSSTARAKRSARPTRRSWRPTSPSASRRTRWPTRATRTTSIWKKATSSQRRKSTDGRSRTHRRLLPTRTHTHTHKQTCTRKKQSIQKPHSLLQTSRIGNKNEAAWSSNAHRRDDGVAFERVATTERGGGE